VILDKFAPPGGLTDLNAAGLASWNMWLCKSVDTAIAGNTDMTNDSPRAQFYNPTKTDTAVDQQIAEVRWTAFPRRVAIKYGSDTQRWKKTDESRDRQDEYCEWSVTRRSSDNKISRVTFTCEGPEYWETLAATSPHTVLALYRQHVSPTASQSDLFDATGTYKHRNRWNRDSTNGAMHLVQENNTLGAEIELAAAATIVREINGRVLTGEQELINCSRYGAPQRNSDPHIGGVVNSLAQRHADIALANPVGLYFDDLSTAGWAAPDGSDPKKFWSYTRGTEGHFVRAVYEVPSNESFVVGDITINGTPITFGGQVADYISMKLMAIACRFRMSTVAPMTACVGARVAATTAKRTAAPPKFRTTRRPD